LFELCAKELRQWIYRKLLSRHWWHSRPNPQEILLSELQLGVPLRVAHPWRFLQLPQDLSSLQLLFGPQWSHPMRQVQKSRIPQDDLRLPLNYFFCPLNKNNITF
jgi:hypothetical protein